MSPEQDRSLEKEAPKKHEQVKGATAPGQRKVLDKLIDEARDKAIVIQPKKASDEGA